MLDKITWPVVALVAIVLAGIFGLSAIHADTRIILDALLVLGVGGVGVGLASVHSNVNGRFSEMLRIVKDAADKLYQANPPSSDSNGDGTEV